MAVAAIGGALYIALAQLLVAVDDWLSHGVVEVTGYDLANAIEEIAIGFHNIVGSPGEVPADMLLIVLMMIMLISGVILWFVLVLRKIAILVVVAFAPLLIAGYLWAPTRAWVRKATEVLIALVFTKSAIFALFGIGLALLGRGSDQSLSDFVGTTVLMCGACFAPLVMLKLVHFAADTHLAGEAMGTLRGGAQPVLDRLPGHRTGGRTGSAMGRKDLAASQGRGPRSQDPAPNTAAPTNGAPPAAPPGAPAAPPAASGATGGAAGTPAGGAGAAAGGMAAVGAVAGAAVSAAQQAASAAAATTDAIATGADPGERPVRGPDLSTSDHDGGER